MACTIAVARHGLHHSFVRICQALRVALERTPLARILGVAAVDGLLAAWQPRHTLSRHRAPTVTGIITMEKAH
jgi:hypothetical protein